RINRLKELEEMRDTGEFYRRPKKELAVLNRELYKLEKSLGGIKNMRGKPDVLFIIDQKRELIAVAEAKKIGVTVMGIIDTNCDPEGIDYVIPGNDDSIRSIKLIMGKIADSIIDGKQGVIKENVEKLSQETTEEAVAPPLVGAMVGGLKPSQAVEEVADEFLDDEEAP
ncbi:MAG TPA: 30S ribosomal protein S2, partial [Oculatellaceae cyanobacterium]